MFEFTINLELIVIYKRFEFTIMKNVDVRDCTEYTGLGWAAAASLRHP